MLELSVREINSQEFNVSLDTVTKHKGLGVTLSWKLKAVLSKIKTEREIANELRTEILLKHKGAKDRYGSISVDPNKLTDEEWKIFSDELEEFEAIKFEIPLDKPLVMPKGITGLSGMDFFQLSFITPHSEDLKNDESVVS